MICNPVFGASAFVAQNARFIADVGEWDRVAEATRSERRWQASGKPVAFPDNVVRRLLTVLL
jgi:hypothetical protein